VASITEVPTGWRARWRTPEGASRSKTFRRKVDAENWLTNVGHRKLTGDYADPSGGKVRFADRYDRWLATTVNLRPSTRARDESYARSLILPTFGERRLGDIDHDSVQAWVAELLDRGYAPATVHRAHQIMAKVLRSAVKARLLARNPCDDTELPTIEREEQRFVTPTEVATLADAINQRYRVAVFVAAYGGLRAGELFGLRRGRVDLLRRQVDVAETVVEVKGRHTFGPPKTRAGRRVVPLPRFVVGQLESHLAGLEPGALVFPAPEGGPVRASLWRRRVWQPAVNAAGLEPLRLHDLRHSAVAFWIAAGASPKEIAARAGHTSVVTVLDRYGHLLDTGDNKVTDALDAMAREAAQPVATVTQLR
jgi:integrase